MAGHVHILISPLLNPQLTYEEVVPDTYHKIQVVEYYKERGWDVLVIPDEEVCGDVTKCKWYCTREKMCHANACSDLWGGMVEAPCGHAAISDVTKVGPT